MASIFTTFPLLRKAAPILSRQFFICQAAQNVLLRPIRPPKNSAFLRAFRTKGPSASTASWERGMNIESSSPLSSLSKTIGHFKSKESFFPKTSDKVVAYWLLGSAASVFGLVVFGGLTRLTESG